jgi:pimeloyl-ACP methyl ester carboxylesterase
MPEHVPAAPETGYAPVNGLQMYYELHGAGGTPLLLLHGGLGAAGQARRLRCRHRRME